jgi:hypothetical protein
MALVAVLFLMRKPPAAAPIAMEPAATTTPSAPAAVTPAATTPAATTPAATTRAPAATVTHWRLLGTSCLPNAVPASVTTTQKGSALHTHAAGFPDTHGSADPDGRFRVHNAFGTCSGKMSNGVVTETCTNQLNMSCQATYEQRK